ncbi:thioesterase family protein, partial [Mycobacterium tuberculosis]|nr:thioesterase family protein [Mycobacterium tuberculosis]
ASPPDLPAPQDCMPMADGPREFLDAAPIVSQYDMRLDPATAGFAAGKPSGRGLLQGWIRLGDGADADPLALLAFLDAFPPVMFDLG